MELLRRLTETPGVPGREERIRQVIVDETRGMFDSVETDTLGNLICFRKSRLKPKRGARPLKVMLACHIDEIGFYVRHIDDRGFLRLHNAGGFDTRNLFARRVLVQGRKDLHGVLNPCGRPIHIATDEEKRKVYKVNEFYVDLGLPRSQVSKLVTVGDPVTLVQEVMELGDYYTGKSFDNRTATWVAINALRALDGRSPYDIYYVATVQEEVGLRGALTSTFNIKPDVGIALDTTLACDTPGVPAEEAVSQLGKGVAIKLMDGASISSRSLVDEFVATAKSHRIPYQLEILPLGGTDAGALQRGGGGSRAITLSVPTRYIHTVTETIHKKDLRSAANLLRYWLAGRSR